MSKFLIIIIFLFFCIRSPVEAFDMESSRYQLEVDNLNFDDQKQNQNTDFLYPLSNADQERFKIKGYFVKTGYQYSNYDNQLIVSLKGINNDFVDLTANNPKTSKIEITNSFIGIDKLQIGLITEDYFRTLEGNYLENTKCDGGDNTCSIFLAKPWVSKAAYGFGYNIASGLLPDFINTDYYRSLPSVKNNDDPIYISPDLIFKDQQKIVINFKLNISPSQKKGNYKSIIDFIITPPF